MRGNRLSQLILPEAETLDALPSQPSRVPAGKYAVRCEKEKKVPAEGEVVGSDNVRADIWFQTGPLDLYTIQRIRGLKIFAETRDQGVCENPAGGNWTWLELAILEKESDRSPKKSDDIDLVWFDHAIRHDIRSEEETGNYRWRHGNVFRKKHKLLRFLEPGNCIAVRLCARFQKWQISGKTAYLVIDIDNEPVKRNPPNLSKVKEIVSNVEMIHDALSDINTATQAPFQPGSMPISKSLRRIDSAIGWERPLRVLALDGGGVRGLSSLKILKAVMDEIPGKPKPCEVFDMIGGTSTGGLIAIMLGRLEMDVQECIDHYKDDMVTIFGKKEKEKWLERKWRESKKKGNFALKGRSYDAEPLEKTIQKLVLKKLGDREAKLFDETNSNKCKVFVMAFDKARPNNSGPVYLRSYKHEHIVFPDIKIWEAARATSAAPTYFDPMKVDGYELIDGGMGANNPLGWLWNEIVGVFGATSPTDCFLSIGTGIPANEMLGACGITTLPAFAGALSSIATNTQITHILFGTLIKALAPVATEQKYWRLNLGQDGQDDTLHDNYDKLPELDDSGKIRLIEQTTAQYTNKWTSDIVACAEALNKKIPLDEEEE